MAKRPQKIVPELPRKPPLILRLFWWLLRAYLKFWIGIFLVLVLLIALLKWVNPPVTILMGMEYQRLGRVQYTWRDLEDMSPNIPLAIAAAEDANFCTHNGFDFEAVMSDGSGRGASTISQQVAKNVFLWPSRSWLRKGLEAGMTVMIESLWGKRRIMEVYLNVAEFGEGVFGIDVAVAKHFRNGPENLLISDAARLAIVLPNPRRRNPNTLQGALRRRVSQIGIGASTLRAEGRADCFLPKSIP